MPGITRHSQELFDYGWSLPCEAHLVIASAEGGECWAPRNLITAGLFIRSLHTDRRNVCDNTSHTTLLWPK